MAKTSEQSGPAVVVLERDLLQSRAYLSLTGKSPQVLGLFMAKRRLKKDSTRRERWTITNNGEIVFTYAEAENKWGFSRSRFKRALAQLIDRGFIEVASPGTGLLGSKNLYRISECWRQWGTDRFKLAEPPPKVNYGGFKKGHPRFERRPDGVSQDGDIHGDL